MPRFARLLSALLVALIGVLVVQMFLFAALHAKRAAPPDPSFAAVPALPPAPPDAMPIVIVVAGVAPRHPAPQPPPMSNAMLDAPHDAGSRSRPEAGGEDLIERFIALTGKPLPAPARKEP